MIAWAPADTCDACCVNDAFAVHRGRTGCPARTFGNVVVSVALIAAFARIAHAIATCGDAARCTTSSRPGVAVGGAVIASFAIIDDAIAALRTVSATASVAVTALWFADDAIATPCRSAFTAGADAVVANAAVSGEASVDAVDDDAGAVDVDARLDLDRAEEWTWAFVGSEAAEGS